MTDVQKNLLEQVSAKDIIIGHSIDNDLRCLHLEHRRVRRKKSKFSTNFVSGQVVDTSRVFPHPAGPPKCRSLKGLAKEFLNREIQQKEDGHDSREDALAALDLMKFKLVLDFCQTLFGALAN